MKIFVAILILSLPLAVSAQEIPLKRLQVETEEGFKTIAFFGTLEVPINRKTPEKGRTKIAFEIYKALSPNPGTPIYYLAGGPGGSGLEFARSAHHGIINKLRQLADVVVIDQRGCGGHDPRLLAPNDLKCAPGQSIEEFLRASSTATAFELWNQRMESAGIDISSFNTLENAADVRDLQIALGHARINLWAFSYGSHLALAYMKCYPDLVERAVLGAVNGLDQRVRSPLNMDSVFIDVDKLVRASPEISRYFPMGLMKTIETTLSKLDEAPLYVRNAPFVQERVEIFVSRYDLVAALSILGNESWFISDMPAFFYNLANGRAAFSGYYVHAAIKSKNFGTAMAYSAHRASGAPDSMYKRLVSESRSSIFADAINFPYNAVPIDSWDVKDLGDEFRAPFLSDVPVLFFSGSLDFRSPPVDAERVRKQFPNSSHVVIRNTTHQVWSASPRVPEMMFSFFQGKAIQDEIIDRSFFEFRHPQGEEIVYALSIVAKKSTAENLLAELEAFLKGRGESRLTFTIASGLIDNLTFTGELDKAIVVARQMTKDYPSYYRSHEKLGDLLKKAKMKTASTECYAKALELNPYSMKIQVALSE